MEYTMWTAFGLALAGALVGLISGVLGIGGGVMIIPILVFFFGFSQQKANGTSLAMLLPPIGIFAVISYYRAGNIDMRAAMLLALGFFATVPIGAWLVNKNLIPVSVMRYGFAALLIYVAGRLIFQTQPADRAMIGTLVMMAFFPLVLILMRLTGKKMEASPVWGKIYHAKFIQSEERDFEI